MLQMLINDHSVEILHLANNEVLHYTQYHTMSCNNLSIQTHPVLIDTFVRSAIPIGSQQVSALVNTYQNQQIL